MYGTLGPAINILAKDLRPLVSYTGSCIPRQQTTMHLDLASHVSYSTRYCIVLIILVIIIITVMSSNYSYFTYYSPVALISVTFNSEHSLESVF